MRIALRSFLGERRAAPAASPQELERRLMATLAAVAYDGKLDVGVSSIFTSRPGAEASRLLRAGLDAISVSDDPSRLYRKISDVVEALDVGYRDAAFSGPKTRDRMMTTLRYAAAARSKLIGG